MPVDARCKLVYLSGAIKKDEQSIPRAVFQRLWPDDAVPSNPTQLANALGVGKTSLRGWYTSMPADRQEQIAVRYGFTSDLRRSWAEDACQKFKELYELHWRPMLTRQGHRVDQLSACRGSRSRRYAVPRAELFRGSAVQAKD
jgi:hypothetical protein